MKHQKIFVSSLNVACTLEIGDFRKATQEYCGARAKYAVKHPRLDAILWRCEDHMYLIGMERVNSCSNEIFVRLD